MDLMQLPDTTLISSDIWNKLQKPLWTKGIVIPSERWTRGLFAKHNCTARHWRGSRLALDFSKAVLWTGRRWWGNLAMFPGPGSWYAKWLFLSGPWPFFLLPAWTAKAVPPALNLLPPLSLSFSDSVEQPLTTSGTSLLGSVKLGERNRFQTPTLVLRQKQFYPCSLLCRAQNKLFQTQSEGGREVWVLGVCSQLCMSVPHEVSL